MLQITENRSPKVKEKEEPQEDDWSKTKVYEGVTRLFRENLLLIIIKVLPVAFEEVPTTVSPSDTIIFLFLLFWFSSTEGRILIVRVRTENQKSPIFDWKKEDYDGVRPSVEDIQSWNGFSVKPVVGYPPPPINLRLGNSLI